MMVLLQACQRALKDVDHVFNGLQKSDLILVAARPAMGKTSFHLEHRSKRNDVVR